MMKLIPMIDGSFFTVMYSDLLREVFLFFLFLLYVLILRILYSIVIIIIKLINNNNIQGNGVQLLLSVLFTLLYSYLIHSLSPEHRGAFFNRLIWFYCGFASVGVRISTWLYGSFGGTKIIRHIVVTILFIPCMSSIFQ